MVVGSDPARAPMVVAACALLLGSGRADFTETEINAEVERLAGELRQRWGFSDEERAAGAELWGEVAAKLEVIEVKHCQYEPKPLSELELSYYLRPIHSPGLCGGRLWLTAPGGCGMVERRFRHLLDQLVTELRPDQEIKVAFMAQDPRENGAP